MTCDPDVQLERLIGRGSARDDAAERIAAQGDLATRLRPAATHVLDTSGSPDGHPVPGRWNGWTTALARPESSDRPGHRRQPGRSGGAPGQRRGDGCPVSRGA